MDDLIYRQDAIDAIGNLSDEMYRTVEKGATFPTKAWFDGMAQAEHIVKNLPSAQQEPQWIPIKTRPMDNEEIEWYREHFGYDIEDEEAIMYDCKMPEDGQEVWVCYKNGIVSQDVCDEDCGMIGLEGNGDWDGIVAWMPLYKPEPWKGERNESV